MTLIGMVKERWLMTSSIEDLDKDRDLYAAIGRVASTSAALEDSLRWILYDFCGSDEAALLFDGQATEWLINSCRAIIKGAYHPESNWMKRYQAPLLSLLSEASWLRVERNFVIHSTWSREKPSVGADSYLPRPKGAPEDSRIYYFQRSARRIGFEEKCLAVSDIEALADRISDLNVRLRAAFREAIEVAPDIRLQLSKNSSSPPE
jgi:hypothetical protein